MLPTGKIEFDTQRNRDVLEEMRQMLEHLLLAVKDTHGSDQGQMKDATQHLVTIRSLMGATALNRTRDRERWPEGEGQE